MRSYRCSAKKFFNTCDFINSIYYCSINSKRISQNKKLSVVQVIDRLNIGGAEQVLVNIANLLHRHGHEVTVVTTVSKGPLAEKLGNNIPVINLGRKCKWNPATMYRLIKAVKPFDIIHVHSSFNLRYLFLASKLFGLNKPIFFHEHFGDINIDQSVPWHKKFIYPRTIFIAVSKQIADWATGNLKIDGNKVFVLPNIVLKEETYDVVKKQNQLLVVANFRPTKNISFAIKLFENLIKTNNNFYLTILGQTADEAYYQNMLQLIKEKKLDDKINIITNCNSVQQMLPNFDLALHTAVSESGPLVLIEYLAQQLPFLTYQTGEVVHQIKSGLPEMVMDNFEIEEWKKRICKLLEPEKYTSLQSRLQQVFDKYYSSEQYYGNCIEIYTKGLGL